MNTRFCPICGNPTGKTNCCHDSHKPNGTVLSGGVLMLLGILGATLGQLISPIMYDAIVTEVLSALGAGLCLWGIVRLIDQRRIARKHASTAPEVFQSAIKETRRWTAIAGVTALLWIAGLSVGDGAFSYVQVCTQCGAVQYTRDWYLHKTSLVVKSSSRLEETPMSLVLTTNSIVKAHNHDWLFSHGGGHGIKCALGDGGKSLQSARSKHIADGIGVLLKNGETNVARMMQLGLLNPATAGAYNRLYWGMVQPSSGRDEINYFLSSFREQLAEDSEYMVERRQAGTVPTKE